MQKTSKTRECNLVIARDRQVYGSCPIESFVADIAGGQLKLLAGDLDPDDYKQVKTEAERKIAGLRSILASASNMEREDARILRTAENGPLNLAGFYQRASVEDKRKLVGCLYPDNLIYDGEGFIPIQPGKAAGLISTKRS